MPSLVVNGEDELRGQPANSVSHGKLAVFMFLWSWLKWLCVFLFLGEWIFRRQRCIGFHSRCVHVHCTELLQWSAQVAAGGPHHASWIFKTGLDSSRQRPLVSSAEPTSAFDDDGWISKFWYNSWPVICLIFHYKVRLQICNCSEIEVRLHRIITCAILSLN